MFYLTLGYFISYLAYALLAKAFSDDVPWIDDSPPTRTHCPSDRENRTHCPSDTDNAEPAVASPDDHRLTAALVQQDVQKRLAERFL